MSLLFNTLSRWVIAFLLRSKHLLISWLQAPSAVILEPKEIKSVTVSTVFPSICHEVIGLDAMILVFWKLSFKTTFSLSSFTFSKRLFSSSFLYAFCHMAGVICISKVIAISPGNLDYSLCFFQPSILHDVLCIYVKQPGWQYTTLMYFFPNFEPVCCFMSGSNGCFLPYIGISQKAGKMVWYSQLLKNFPVCCDPSFALAPNNLNFATLIM